MNRDMKNVLFIVPDLSRTGAPMVLLHFLKWLKLHHPQVNTYLLYLKNGELSNDFRKNVKQMHGLRRKPVLEKLKHKLLSGPRGSIYFSSEFKKLLNKGDIDIIYGNSVSSIPVCVKIKEILPATRLVIHVHELERVIGILLPDFKDYLHGIDQFIAVSKLVEEMLIEKYKVPSEKLGLVYEFAEAYESSNKKKENTNFTVGASGTFHWRKGGDVFIQIIRYINANYPEAKIKFVWVGRVPTQEKIILEEDLKKCGIKEKVDFIGNVDNPFKSYRNFDLFILTSREDPFPLVCIENAMLGTPLLGFEGASGIEEVLVKGGGRIIPYLNVEKMAEMIVYYYNNRQDLLLDGKKASELFSIFTPENKCPELFAVVNNHLN